MMTARTIFFSLALTAATAIEAQDIIVTDSTEEKGVVNESFLTFPNAFSPNDDQINDVYMAKTHQNIVEFHATIFNRWGQKLYEWSDVTQGWDGTHRGKPVKQGTYFVVVTARGADEQRYTIRKDVNLLRGFTEGTTLNE